MQKLVRLEEVEEEPEGETIVKLGGEALRAPGKDTTFAQKKILPSGLL